MAQIKQERYRLYIDESGDHVFRYTDHPSHRYLCLLGCWLDDIEYVAFHEQLMNFKKYYVTHHPDEPPILHREEIVNCRGHFSHLKNINKRRVFDNALIELLAETNFRVVGVVIDKLALREKYGDAAAHPYHLALGYLLQRYCGFLNHIGRNGDVMAESRGAREDQLLKDSYTRIYNRGVWVTRESFFRSSLTSKKLKVKKKSANISGLQLSDILAHPVRQIILRENGQITDALSPFSARLSQVLECKYNKQLYDGTIKGYGKAFYPK